MITGATKNQIDQIWNAFRSGGISNPEEAIPILSGVPLLFANGSRPALTPRERVREAFDLPSVGSQRKLGLRFAALEKRRSAEHAPMTKLDALFASLQLRAFRGEL